MSLAMSIDKDINYKIILIIIIVMLIFITRIHQSNVLKNNTNIKTAPNFKRSIQKGQNKSRFHKIYRVKMPRGHHHRGESPACVDDRDHGPRFKS